MKRLLLLFFIVNLWLVSFCQLNKANPPYLRFPTIPKFTIYKAPDSTVFTRENLKKKATVFIIFDPWCDHCQRETDSIIAHISLFKRAQIVMVTPLGHQAMLGFYKNYKIARYPVITMGTDPKNFFPSFYQLRNYPGIYIYDKSGKLKGHYEGSVALNKITGAL